MSLRSWMFNLYLLDSLARSHKALQIDFNYKPHLLLLSLLYTIPGGCMLLLAYGQSRLSLLDAL